MPIYEYRCSHCGHELEALQKISDPALTECPSCRNAALTKLVSAAGFQLKGSGWYATDFRGGAKPSPKANGDGAESKAEAKPASATESKGDAASAAPAAGCGGGCACH